MFCEILKMWFRSHPICHLALCVSEIVTSGRLAGSCSVAHTHTHTHTPTNTHTHTRMFHVCYDAALMLEGIEGQEQKKL